MDYLLFDLANSEKEEYIFYEFTAYGFEPIEASVC